MNRLLNIWMLKKVNYQFILKIQNYVSLPSAIAKSLNIEKVSFNEKQFRWLLNEDQMATEKLAEGIRKFAADTEKLEKVIRQKLQ